MYILDGTIDWRIVIVCVCAILFFAIIGYYSDKVKIEKDKDKLKDDSLNDGKEEKNIEVKKEEVVNEVKEEKVVKELEQDSFPFEDISKVTIKDNALKENAIFDIETTDAALGVLDDALEAESTLNNNDNSPKFIDYEESKKYPNVDTPNPLENLSIRFEHKEEKELGKNDEIDLGKPPVLKTEQEEKERLAVDDIFRI